MAQLFLLLLLGFVASSFASSSLLGGIEKVDPKDPELLKALSYAVDLYNMRSNNLYRSMATQVKDATKQIVAGEKFCIVTVMGTSRSCRNDEEHKSLTLQDCPVDHLDMQCKFEVLIAPWQKQSPEDLLSFKCVGLKEKDLSCTPPAETSNDNHDENVNMVHAKKVILKPVDEEEKVQLQMFDDFIEKYEKNYATDKEGKKY